MINSLYKLLSSIYIIIISRRIYFFPYTIIVDIIIILKGFLNLSLS